ncbi:hypothetical protein WA026_016241 [Henosepilachna vigintioctopunctata]|uniref:Uncharacterized protein n=1 Tax=Henosepilachna vigintioctopunctata TaxID=420089 RepID=A0AAW1TU22_9CUCU
MFYIRSSATMRKRHIERLEAKLSDQSVMSLSERQNHIRINMEQKAAHTSTEREKHKNFEKRKYATPSDNSDSAHQLRFSSRKHKILSVQNITITKECPLAEVNYSMKVNYSQHKSNNILLNEMKPTETICKESTGIVKGNCSDKKKNLNETKIYTKEVKINSSKSTHKSEKERNIPCPIKSKNSTKNLSRTISSLGSTKKIEKGENKADKYLTNPHNRSTKVPKIREYSKKPIESLCNDMNVRKNEEEYNYRTCNGKVNSSIRFKFKDSDDSYEKKPEKKCYDLKSDKVSEYQRNNDNKISEMIYFSEISPGACDVNRNGSGDSESFADNPLQYYASGNKHPDISGISKSELEKLEKFRRINLKIIEAVSNTSDTKFPSVSESDTDEFDEDSEIESLEDMRRKAEEEEEEEILNRCALEACTFLESNFPHYFQHLIKRYQLDVRTSDHSELRTRKGDIIRIASQSNKKLQDREKIYSNY